MVVEERDERGRIALDDIGALITHAHGLKWSNMVFVRLSERGIPAVLCGANHRPVSCVWPLEGHHRQAARMRAQVAASRALAALGRQLGADAAVEAVLGHACNPRSASAPSGERQPSSRSRAPV